MNTWLAPHRKSYFWRNYNQNEVDYVELEDAVVTAYEIKWNTHKTHRVTKAFTNTYPDANTKIITPISFDEFCVI